MKLLEDRRFYVYIYLDPRKPGKYKYGEYEFEAEPFYVGFGHNKRWCSHLLHAKSGYKSYKLNKIRKIKEEINSDPFIIKIEENLTSKKAKMLEIKFIKAIGRYDLSLGPLVNLTDGGDGVNNPSKEARELISKIHKGKKLSEETKKLISSKTKGRKHTAEELLKMSESQKGKIITEQQKEKIRKWHKEVGFSIDVLRRISEAHKGKIISKEMREILSKKRKGIKVSEEHARKNKLAFKGKKHKPETILKMSLSHKGHIVTQETKIKTSKTKKERKTLGFYKEPSNEARQKMGAAWKGKKRSEETKRKMSAWQKGKPKSEKHRKRISEVSRGKKLSEQHKNNISNALKGRESPNKGKKWTEKEKLEAKKKFIVECSFGNFTLFGWKAVTNWCKEHHVSGRGLAKTRKTNIPLRGEFLLKCV